MTDPQKMLELADNLPSILEGWAKAYRDNPQYRFPSDPAAEFFPIDLENAARELRTASERLAAGTGEREALGPRKRIYDSYHGEWIDAGPASLTSTPTSTPTAPVGDVRLREALEREIKKWTIDARYRYPDSEVLASLERILAALPPQETKP